MALIDKIQASKLIQEYGSPLYIYDEPILRTRIKELINSITYPKNKILYACKANTNIEIMRILREEGAWVDTVSSGEIELALKAGFTNEQILFTGDNTSDEEMKYCLDRNIRLNLGSLSQLERYGKMKPNSEVSVRINPDCGAGHHGHTITGGPESKFGIYFNKIDEIQSIADQYNLKIVGIHSHIGSGILEVQEFLKAIDIILATAKEFKDLDFIDFGGGVGIPYKPTDQSINIQEFGKKVSERFQQFCDDYKKELDLYLEPGRFLVAESGTLLVTVTNVKDSPTHRFVGTDSGFNHLLRPMAYGSYHEVVNLSNPDGAKEKVVVTGNLCESGDVFTQNGDGLDDREIAKVSEGDILGIMSAGAYGFSMSSNYNTRIRPAEILVNKGNAKLIRRKETIDDLMRTMLEV